MDEFTYVVSHDLQEPLRTLIAFSDFLLQDYGDRLDANGQEYVRYLVDASRRMRALIHGLLNLSRAGKVTGEFAPVNLDEVVGRRQGRPGRADPHARGPRSGSTGRCPTLWGDRDRIGQLLANLIGNGLKYNRVGRPVGRDRGPDLEGPDDSGHALRPGQRDRHRPPVPRQDLPALPPAAHPRGVRGHRRRPGHLPEDRPGPRRPDLGRERAEQRGDLLRQPPSASRAEAASPPTK